MCAGIHQLTHLRVNRLEPLPLIRLYSLRQNLQLLYVRVLSSQWNLSLTSKPLHFVFCSMCGSPLTHHHETDIQQKHPTHWKTYVPVAMVLS